MKFRKRPVVIEAIQFVNDSSFCQMLNQWGEHFDSVADHEDKKENFFIETLEGTHCANIGDWIIRGVKGEFYPCKPDIFAMTYEPVPEGDEGDEQE